MADSWAERRGRMVKCKIHGLHFDPEMSTGCTRCLREAAKAQPKRPPQLVLILLCLLGMVAILYYIFRPGQERGPGIIDLGVASNPVAEAPRLDPEPYRAMVEELEIALFRTPLDETGDLLVVSADVRTAADDLSSAILELEPASGLTAADLIARLGQAVPNDQIVLADIQRARGQWLRIRRQRFQAAAWFSETSPDGEVTVDTTTADYSNVASDLRALIEDGASEVDALSEPAASGDDNATTRWRNFAGGWRQELDSLASRLPARPDSRAASGLLAARQDLERALSQARALASSKEPPSATDNRFEEAINAALRAQQGFDDLAP